MLNLAWISEANTTSENFKSIQHPEISNLCQHIISGNLKDYGVRGRCPFCDKFFNADLNWHVRAVHLKLKLFECRVCGASFRHRGSRWNHERNIHKFVWLVVGTWAYDVQRVLTDMWAEMIEICSLWSGFMGVIDCLWHLPRCFLNWQRHNTKSMDFYPTMLRQFFCMCCIQTNFDSNSNLCALCLSDEERLRRPFDFILT